MLDLDPSREGATPRDAATLILVRDEAGALEVFCVERHKKSGFLGGAIVFPGGKLDEADRDAAWAGVSTEPRADREGFAPDAETRRALAVAACRESLEEAAILPTVGAALAHDDALAWRARLARGEGTLPALLAEAGLRVDLAALHPFARWVTPVAEARRFDTRFFLAVAGESQRGAHDEHETMASFWAKPRDVLARFDRGELQLAPPTHRTLALLAEVRSVHDAIALAAAASLAPICPRLVKQGDTLALALPGDPEHDVREARVAGSSRFVLRGDRWLSEDAP